MGLIATVRRRAAKSANEVRGALHLDLRARVLQELGAVPGMVSDGFFAKLPDAEPGEAGGIEKELAGYLSTHPVSESRIEALAALARERGWSGQATPRPLRFETGAGEEEAPPQQDVRE